MIEKDRDLAIKLRDRVAFNSSDCRILEIYCDGLCESARAAELIETALDYYIKTPAARMERVLDRE